MFKNNNRVTYMIKSIARISIFALLLSQSGFINAGNNLTNQERSDLAQIIQESKPGVPYTLNLAHDHHHRHVLSQLNKAGHTPKKSPQMHKTVASLRKAHATNPPNQATYSMLAKTVASPQPINAIIEMGRDANTGYNYTATLVSSVPDGTVASTLNLQLFDNTTKASIGSQANKTQYGDGTDASVDATGTWNGTPTNTDELLASGTVSLQPHTGSPAFLNIHNTALAIEVPQAAPTVDDPKQKPGRSVDYILTCLQRPANNRADCDYGPYSGSGSNAQFPMKGNVTYMSAVPTTLDTTNASVTFFIWDDSAGGGCTLGETSANMLSNFSTSGNTVSWDFNRANFGPACFKRMTRVDMSFTIAVKTATSGTDKVPAYVTTQAGGTPFDTTEIDYLEFSWGCLTPNTKILMADGKSKKIKNIKVGDMVLSNQGKTPRKVVSTIKGYEDDDIYIVTDSAGNRVKMTSGHTVLTQDGAVLLARQLKVGNKIWGANGKVTVASIKKKKYKGDVWNLVLEKGKSKNHKSSNFYAGSIMVGDNLMQEYWGEYYEEDHRDILERLPKAWHADYKNWKKANKK